MELLSLAWRNIWRNRRRTLLTAASVFTAVFLALIMRSMQLGSYDKMVRNVVEFYTGYVQVHARGYWDDRTIDKTMALDDSLRDRVRRVPGVSCVIPRLESFALASSGRETKGVMVVGTNAELDNRLTRIAARVTSGALCSEGDRSVVVAQGVAADLHLNVGDTMVLLGQGYHDAGAAGVYPVAGIIRFPSPDLNNRMVYMPLAACQDLFSAPGRITSLALAIGAPARTAAVAEVLRRSLDTDAFEVMTWDQMLLELVQEIRSDNLAGIIMLGILYMIVIFGIFGTITMMTAERRREFGVLIAVGMSKTLLSATLLCEIVMMALLGVACGAVGSIPLIWHFHVHPIRLTGEAATVMTQFGIEPVMPLILDPAIFAAHSAIVIGATLVCALFPLSVIARLRPVTALRT